MREIPKPVPRPNEYLVRITACGVCGSDFEGFLGKTGRRIPPMVMGHECSGIVEQSIDGCKYEPGSKVAIFPKFYCGECETCKSGAVNLCPNAQFMGAMDCNGAMTEYCCVEERYLTPFDGDDGLAAIAEAAAVAFSAVKKIPDAKFDKARHILVVGAGAIGLLAMLWLKYRHAKHVIVCDTSDYRLELAKKLGADDTVNPAKCVFEEEISSLTNGNMCDLSFEAVGISPTAASSVLALRRKGTATWIGNAAKDVTIDMQRVVTTELHIQGTYIYSREDFDACVDLLARGAINAKPLISAHVPLERGTEAFDMLQNNRDGNLVKIIITNP